MHSPYSQRTGCGVDIRKASNEDASSHPILLAGGIISGETSIEQIGEAILEHVIRVASGESRTKAEILGQDDFIPWKSGLSL